MFTALIFYALTIVGLFILRWWQPNLERPYRTFGYPVLPACTCSPAWPVPGDADCPTGVHLAGLAHHAVGHSGLLLLALACDTSLKRKRRTSFACAFRLVLT